MEKFSFSERGFSLAEVAVATGMLAMVSLGVAQMFGLATAKNLAAKHQVSTTTMAMQKMEQLRSLTFSYDSSGLGLPVTDTTTNLTLCTPDGTGNGLNPSPTGALDTNTIGFVDFLDSRGNCMAGTGDGTVAPSGGIYTRRWAIQPLPMNPNNTIVLSVLVTTTAKESLRGSGTRTRLIEDALLTTVRTRKAP